MEEKRRCPNCGKELTKSARKCKYCNAKAPLDSYEVKAQTNDLLKKLPRIICTLICVISLLALIWFDWKKVCYITAFGVILTIYITYTIFLLKEYS